MSEKDVMLVSLLKSSEAAVKKISLEELCLLCVGFTSPLEGCTLSGSFHLWPQYGLVIQGAVMQSSLCCFVFGLQNLYERSEFIKEN